jgi:phosphatidylglycerol:prolipoprotein diacylglycerol transferase
MANFLAESYLHRLDPFAIQFPATWPIPGIRWYGIAYLAGFIVAWGIIKLMARKGRSPVPAESVADLMIYIVIGVLLGGRLGYCIFYDPGLLVSFRSQFPFWGLLAINEGGMASHGGVLGVIAACWIFALRHKLSTLHLLDLTAFTCGPGFFFGRLANFVNGELRGEPLPASMQADPPAWSVKYPDELASGAFDPARLNEVSEPLIQRLGLPPGVGPDELLAVTHRAVVNGREEVIELVTPALTAYWPSQIFQAITDGLIAMGILALIWLRPRKPGVVGAWFLIVYGILRVVTEIYRQPDAGVKTLSTPFGDLSRGQVLSVLMVVAGIIGLIIAARRPVEPMGGLLKPAAPPTAPPGSPGPASG